MAASVWWITKTMAWDSDCDFKISDSERVGIFCINENFSITVNCYHKNEPIFNKITNFSFSQHRKYLVFYITLVFSVRLCNGTLCAILLKVLFSLNITEAKEKLFFPLCIESFFCSKVIVIAKTLFFSFSLIFVKNRRGQFCDSLRKSLTAWEPPPSTQLK